MSQQAGFAASRSLPSRLNWLRTELRVKKNPAVAAEEARTVRVLGCALSIGLRITRPDDEEGAATNMAPPLSKGTPNRPYRQLSGILYDRRAEICIGYRRNRPEVMQRDLLFFLRKLAIATQPGRGAAALLLGFDVGALRQRCRVAAFGGLYQLVIQAGHTGLARRHRKSRQTSKLPDAHFGSRREIQ